MTITGGEAAALRAVGVARRAGCVAVGTRAVRQAARDGQLAAILLARDASPHARERLERVGRASGANLLTCGDRAALGAAVGRGPVAALGVTVSRLADMVLGAAAGGAEGGLCETVSGLEA